MVFKQEIARLLADQRRRRQPNEAKTTARLQEVEREIEHTMMTIKAGILMGARRRTWKGPKPNTPA